MFDVWNLVSRGDETMLERSIFVSPRNGHARFPMSIAAHLTDDLRHVQPQTLRKNKKPKMMISDVSEVVDVDTFTPSGASKSNPIAVDRFSTKIFIDLAANDDDIIVLTSQPKDTPFRRRRVTETGQCSSSPQPESVPEPETETFLCEICVEPKCKNESFSIKGCSHAYCGECMSRYVASKLQDNVTVIGCPVSGCPGGLEPGHCQRILPAEVFERWGSALCEAVILGAHKLYCPYKDCSAMLIHDSGEVIMESECPYCHRMFCARCKVPWHSGIVCEEFEKLGADERGREDLMVRTLAKEKNWVRCPSCAFYVEKVQGCAFVICRCRVEFCFRCGTQVHKSHYCHHCKSS